MMWFDDEHETLEVYLDGALEFGIELIGFSNAEEGIAELKKNFFEYEAIIVDGYFFEYKLNKTDEAHDAAFVKVAAELKSFKDRGKLIPWFIFSGQPSFITEKKPWFNVLIDKNFAGGKIFEKTPKDFVLLCQTILKTVEESDSNELKSNYSEVLHAIEKHIDPYLGKGTQTRLLEILKSLKNPKDSFDDELYFIKIRMILEALFRSAIEYGLLHENCISQDGKVNLTESSLFLAGEPTKHLLVGCKKKHFPRIISDIVKSILFITGAAAHTVDPQIERNIDLKDYRHRINTPYLLYSLAFQLMDVLLWYKSYVEENPDKEYNKSHWIKTIGPIKQDNAGNYFCGEVLLKKNYIEKYFKVEDEIKITEWDDNKDLRTKAQHPLFATRIERHYKNVSFNKTNE